MVQQYNKIYDNFYVGRHTYGYNDIRPLDWGEGKKLYIGNYCSLATSLVFFLGGNHRSDWVTTYPFNVLRDKAKHIKGHPSSNGDIVIGNDVWIGRNVTIMSGINVGDGAIIATNSTITKNVEPYTIVGGNPMRVIKKRFSEEQISDLLNIKWWFWDDNKVEENYELLCSDNIDNFINKHKIQ